MCTELIHRALGKKATVRPVDDCLRRAQVHLRDWADERPLLRLPREFAHLHVLKCTDVGKGLWHRLMKEAVEKTFLVIPGFPIRNIRTLFGQSRGRVGGAFQSPAYLLTDNNVLFEHEHIFYGQTSVSRPRIQNS